MLLEHHWFVVFLCASFVCLALPLLTLWVVNALWTFLDYTRRLRRLHRLRDKRIPPRTPSRFDGARKKL